MNMMTMTNVGSDSLLWVSYFVKNVYYFSVSILSIRFILKTLTTCWYLVHR